MFYQIIINVPIWVWPLFFGLLALGFLASRSRKAPIFVFWALPILAVMAVNSMIALEASILAWLVFAIFYIVGGLYGHSFQKDIVLKRSPTHVHLKGEWLTMICIMVIFWMSFARGMTTALQPELMENPIVIAIIAVILGSVSGVFLGRSVQTLFGKLKAAG